MLGVAVMGMMGWKLMLYDFSVNCGILYETRAIFKMGR